jgi:hypothetical protein
MNTEKMRSVLNGKDQREYRLNPSESETSALSKAPVKSLNDYDEYDNEEELDENGGEPNYLYETDSATCWGHFSSKSYILKLSICLLIVFRVT